MAKRPANGRSPKDVVSDLRSALATELDSLAVWAEMPRAELAIAAIDAKLAPDLPPGTQPWKEASDRHNTLALAVTWCLDRLRDGTNEAVTHRSRQPVGDHAHLVHRGTGAADVRLRCLHAGTGPRHVGTGHRHGARRGPATALDRLVVARAPRRHVGRAGHHAAGRHGGPAASRAGVRELPAVRAGELDVVAWDPAARCGLVLDVEWSSEPDGCAQTARRDDVLLTGQRQAEARRAQVEDGSIVWPEALPPYDQYSWTWFVVGGTTLPRKPRNHAMAVPATGLGHLDLVLSGEAPAMDLATVIERLRSPRLPWGWDLGRQPETYRVGDRVLVARYVRLSYDVVQADVLGLAEAVRSAGPGEVLALSVGSHRYGRYSYLGGQQIRRLPAPSRTDGGGGPAGREPR